MVHRNRNRIYLFLPIAHRQAIAIFCVLFEGTIQCSANVRPLDIICIFDQNMIYDEGDFLGTDETNKKLAGFFRTSNQLAKNCLPGPDCPLFHENNAANCEELHHRILQAQLESANQRMEAAPVVGEGGAQSPTAAAAAGSSASPVASLPSSASSTCFM